MLRTLAVVVLSLAAVGVGFWGYQEHKEKNAILINAENNYQRAFHNLTFGIDRIHDQIGATLAMNSRKSLSPALADVWRLTSQAQSDVGQLPLTLLPFNKTEELLGSIGEFSYKTAVRDLDKEPLTDKEYARLKSLYKQSGNIQNELRKVQHMTLKNNLRWMDVELALATEKEGEDNTIIDGFKTVEKKAEGYSETNTDPLPGNTNQLSANYLKDNKGAPISKKEAQTKALNYIQMKQVNDIKVTKSGKGSDFSFYSVYMKNKYGEEANIDITRRGGYPLWYIVDREIGKQNISLNEASDKAVAFLNRHQMKGLVLDDSTQYDNVGVFAFVGQQSGIRIYPDAVKVKVALDNGQVIGVTANEYFENHHNRKLSKPALTEKEAEEFINQRVNIQEKRLAVIQNELNQEVLCYEFLGTLGEETYRILINAKDGTEEQVEKLRQVEPVYDNLL
ncbi:germination protein YpeB [Pseudobacillus badius]|uniref:germination protein YpeB n=1 Tax=Bacillus badius TaxID=1455 RepID=UPI0007B0B1CA|nr:germination protein YpeB [Bacillus badius]KZN98954.1 germination protein YpeB [Bacillus badius]MED0664886.1 germination protein YpeB [Bacillus badius]OCS83890.1 germination protein YpeB [Bacillus badius]OVE52817.1 germination protein YpeB [Bacillus badius]TDW04840.1 spore germination protein [Bacillus badius]